MYNKDWFKTIFSLFLTSLLHKVPNTSCRFWSNPSADWNVTSQVTPVDPGTQADQDVRVLLLSWNGPGVEYDDKVCIETPTYCSYLNPTLAKVSSKNSPPPPRNDHFKKFQMTKGTDSIYIQQSV